jgi:acyl-[acyl-carrier-protein]-phospholipid O-acyltransferase/long-chain-fatty-acid--[acyl-carrier-protein] ligase
MLVTDRPNPEHAALRSLLAAKGLSELSIPKKIIHTEELPRIGVGKTDYRTAAKIAAERG